MHATSARAHRVRRASVALVVVVVLFTTITAASKGSLGQGLLYGGLPALIVGGIALGVVLRGTRSREARGD